MADVLGWESEKYETLSPLVEQWALGLQQC
jgi:hypothetical protein